MIINTVWQWRCVRTHWVSQMGAWTDGQNLWDCGRWSSVGHCSLLLSLFFERTRWQGRSSNASVSLSPDGVLGLAKKGHIDKGGRLAFMKQSKSCNASVPKQSLRSSSMETLQEGATENTAFPHSLGKRRHTCGRRCCTTAWESVEVVWGSLTSLAHKEGFTAQIHWTCYGDLLYGSFVKVFTN